MTRLAKKNYKVPPMDSRNWAGLVDMFGNPLRKGDRILKTNVSRYGSTRAWYLVRGFGMCRNSGHPVLYTHRIYGFNRPHKRHYTHQVKRKVSPKKGRLAYPKGSIFKPSKCTPSRHQSTTIFKIKAGEKDKDGLYISRKVGTHYMHAGYYIDHLWRKGRKEAPCQSCEQ